MVLHQNDANILKEKTTKKWFGWENFGCLILFTENVHGLNHEGQLALRNGEHKPEPFHWVSSEMVVWGNKKRVKKSNSCEDDKV